MAQFPGSLVPKGYGRPDFNQQVSGSIQVGRVGTIGWMGTVYKVQFLGTIGRVNQVGTLGRVNWLGTMGKVKFLGTVGRVNQVGTLGRVNWLGTVGKVSFQGTVGRVNQVGTLGRVNWLGTVGKTQFLGTVGKITRIGSISKINWIGTMTKLLDARITRRATYSPGSLTEWSSGTYLGTVLGPGSELKSEMFSSQSRGFSRRTFSIISKGYGGSFAIISRQDINLIGVNPNFLALIGTTYGPVWIPQNKMVMRDYPYAGWGVYAYFRRGGNQNSQRGTIAVNVWDMT